MTKTQQAGQALLNAHPIKNRGHAFVTLKEAGLTGSGAVFNGAVKIYEAQHGPLGQSAAAERKQRDSDLRAKAHQMSAAQVSAHLNAIDGPDPLFWALWKVFKHEGKWSKQLRTGDFAIHFNREDNNRQAA